MMTDIVSLQLKSFIINCSSEFKNKQGSSTCSLQDLNIDFKEGGLFIINVTQFQPF